MEIQCTTSLAAFFCLNFCGVLKTSWTVKENQTEVAFFVIPVQVSSVAHLVIVHTHLIGGFTFLLGE